MKEGRKDVPMKRCHGRETKEHIHTGQKEDPRCSPPGVYNYTLSLSLPRFPASLRICTSKAPPFGMGSEHAAAGGGSRGRLLWSRETDPREGEKKHDDTSTAQEGLVPHARH